MIFIHYNYVPVCRIFTYLSKKIPTVVTTRYANSNYVPLLVWYLKLYYEPHASYEVPRF